MLLTKPQRFQSLGSRQEAAASPSIPALQRLILVISSPLRMNGNQLVKSVAVELGTKELEHSNTFIKNVTLVWLSSVKKPYSIHLFCVLWIYVFFLRDIGWEKSSHSFNIFSQRLEYRLFGECPERRGSWSETCCWSPHRSPGGQGS